MSMPLLWFTHLQAQCHLAVVCQVPFTKNCGDDDVCTSELDLTVAVVNLHRYVIYLFFFQLIIIIVLAAAAAEVVLVTAATQQHSAIIICNKMV